jgi:hypothetical protein
LEIIMLRFTERMVGSSHVARREFLRIGGLSCLGAGFGTLWGGSTLAQDAAAFAKVALPKHLRDKSVIFVFCHGGPSQYETFDPKLSAPAGIRSVTGGCQTLVPGMTFGGSFQKLAQLADRVSIVRSYQSSEGNHNIRPIVGKETLGANLGSWYARIAGTNRPHNGMPTNAALFPRAVDPAAQPHQEGFGKFDSAGSLGSSYAPFIVGGGGSLQRDMELKLSRSRLDDRRALLAELDRVRAVYQESGASQERFRDQAFDAILGGVASAFDLSKEDPRTIARYDTALLTNVGQISQKWNNHKFYADHGRTLGKLLLLARRLCEAGAGFVTVTTNFVFDYHADNNNAGCEEGSRYTCLPLDHALAALLTDLQERGLSDKVLVVVTGEMGRTPKLNKNGGRDHWGNITPLLLAGGGLRMGQIIGQSSRDGGEPGTEPLRPENLYGTIMNTLFDLGELRLSRSAPTELLQKIAGWEPIPGLS